MAWKNLGRYIDSIERDGEVLRISRPVDVELEAGDMIQIELESPSDTKETSKFDEQQSGRYIILHLCHHFDSDRSITSLTLVRDTYGRRKRKK